MYRTTGDWRHTEDRKVPRLRLFIGQDEIQKFARRVRQVQVEAVRLHQLQQNRLD